MVKTSGDKSTRNKLYEQALPSETILLADRLSRATFISDFFLVGGTALALQLGHRLSIDLDFFTRQEFNPIVWKKEVEDLNIQGIKTSRPNYFRIDSVNAKLEMLYFTYENYYPFLEWKGIKVMDKRDIALFKLLAIIGRNRKKDIVDLYFIDKEVMDLELLINDFFDKYSNTDINLLKQVETLMNEDALLNSEMPHMLIESNWETMYTLVKEKITKSIKKQIGI